MNVGYEGVYFSWTCFHDEYMLILFFELLHVIMCLFAILVVSYCQFDFDYKSASALDCCLLFMSTYLLV